MDRPRGQARLIFSCLTSPATPLVASFTLPLPILPILPHYLTRAPASLQTPHPTPGPHSPHTSHACSLSPQPPSLPPTTPTYLSKRACWVPLLRAPHHCYALSSRADWAAARADMDATPHGGLPGGAWTSGAAALPTYPTPTLPWRTVWPFVQTTFILPLYAACKTGPLPPPPVPSPCLACFPSSNGIPPLYPPIRMILPPRYRALALHTAAALLTAPHNAHALAYACVMALFVDGACVVVTRVAAAALGALPS